MSPNNSFLALVYWIKVNEHKKLQILLNQILNTKISNIIVRNGPYKMGNTDKIPIKNKRRSGHRWELNDRPIHDAVGNGKRNSDRSVKLTMNMFRGAYKRSRLVFFILLWLMCRIILSDIWIKWRLTPMRMQFGTLWCCHPKIVALSHSYVMTQLAIQFHSFTHTHTHTKRKLCKNIHTLKRAQTWKWER